MRPWMENFVRKYVLLYHQVSLITFKKGSPIIPPLSPLLYTVMSSTDAAVPLHLSPPRLHLDNSLGAAFIGLIISAMYIIRVQLSMQCI